MSELRGIEWLKSDANRQYERRVLRTIFPFLVAGSALAKAGVILLERDCKPTKQVERALTPGNVYFIEKIGSAESGRPFSRLLSKTMLDEIPQLLAVRSGQVALVGPQGTLPEHRERLFDIAGGKVADDWRRILEPQRHGLLSTYAHLVHRRKGGEDPFYTRSDDEMREEVLTRYEADKRDFVDASRTHSQRLVSECISIIRTKIIAD